MNRPLAMFERALYLDGSLHINVMVTARIWGRISEQKLRQALTKVQAKHAVLRCLVLQEKGRPYFAVQDQPVPIPLRIVARKNDDDWFDISTQDSLQRFDGSRLPLARLIWLRAELENELLLVCSHSICDGRSLMTLLHEILLLCDQPDADIGPPTTLNSIQEIFPAKVLADKALRRSIRWQVALVKLMLRFTRSGHGHTYGKIYRSLWTLDEQTSKLFVARCKAEGVNVFSALSVAFMQAFHNVCGPKHIKRFEAPVDIRRYLPELRSDSLFAVAPTITLSLQKLHGVDAATSNFWALARALKADITTKIDKLESTVYKLFLGMELLHDAYDRMAVKAQSTRAGHQVSLSYVGKLDLAQSYSDFRLQDICDISAMMLPTPANIVAMYSFAGRFHFSLSSDESSLSSSQAIHIKKQVMDTLTACATTRQTPVAPQAAVLPAAHVEVS